MAVAIEEIRDAAALTRALRADWDRLAVELDRPLLLSDWMLAAHRHVPGGRDMRLLIARDGGTIVGLMALETLRWPGPGGVEEDRLVGSQLGRGAGPLALRGREAEVAAAFAAHLRERSGDARWFLRLDWLMDSDPWAGLIHDAWPGRLRVDSHETLPAPSLRLDPSADHAAWLSGHSKNFRDTLKRKTRDVTRRGGVVRLATPSTAEADARALFAVHHRRFRSLDRWTELTEGHERAVVGSAARLAAAGHLRLWVVEHADDGVVGGQLHLVAGRRMRFWNGGIDPAWARQSLGLVLLHAAVRDAIELGVEQMDLGGGAQQYKLRFANGMETLRSHSFWPIGRGYPIVRARVAGRRLDQRARRLLREHLADERLDAVRAARDKVKGLRG